MCSCSSVLVYPKSIYNNIMVWGRRLCVRFFPLNFRSIIIMSKTTTTSVKSENFWHMGKKESCVGSDAIVEVVKATDAWCRCIDWTLQCLFLTNILTLQFLENFAHKVTKHFRPIDPVKMPHHLEWFSYRNISSKSLCYSVTSLLAYTFHEWERN